MCGPYGHGYYVAETDEILSEYMTKNAHGEFPAPTRRGWVSDLKYYGDLCSPSEKAAIHAREYGQFGERRILTDIALNPIPYGIIPATGEVVVQQSRMPPPTGVLTRSVYLPGTAHCRGFTVPRDVWVAPADLSTRAKSRIRATWDVAVPTVAELCKWIEAHYGKRSDRMEWVEAAPKLLCIEAQRRFFPSWWVHTFGGHRPDRSAMEYLARGQDHHRICEALKRGGANDFWKQADKEDRKASAELVLAAN